MATEANRLAECRLAILAVREAKLALKGGRIVWGKDEMDRRWRAYRAACAVINLFTNEELRLACASPRSAALEWLQSHRHINWAGAERMQRWAARLPDE